MEHALTKGGNPRALSQLDFLGRGAWGIEMAARSYFGKPAKALSALEGALLAGLAKGPNYFNPDHHPERAQRAPCLRAGTHAGRRHDRRHRRSEQHCRSSSILGRRDGTSAFTSSITRPRGKGGRGPRLSPIPPTRCARQVNSALQRVVEATLQEGLARYELSIGRYKFEGPEANISDAVRLSCG